MAISNMARSSRTNTVAGSLVIPARPEPATPTPKWVDKPALLKVFKWTEADFDAAQLFANFPIASKRSPRPGAIGVVLVWRDADLADWRDRMQTAITQMRSLIER